MLIKKIFIGLLTGIISASYHTKFVLLSNQKCMVQPTLTLHPNEYSQEYPYYSFPVKLGRCVLEVVILLMAYLIKYLFQVKQKIQI